MTASENRGSSMPLGADAKRRGKGFTDIHCHCLPGLDDGPKDLARALRLCQALVEDGITEVVASPTV